MKMTKVIRMAMLALVGCLTLNALAADPTISDVVARQRWPWSQLVDIDYVLTCDATQSVDVAITAKDGSTTLTLPAESLSGNINGVSAGMRRIVFDPIKTSYTNAQMLTQFSVTLAPTPSPVYMIVDLTKAAGADGQIEYIYPGDARLETYGRFTNVWFGVTNDSVYATDKLVMRRVRAGTFNMGPNSVATTLTKDFYAGVFEVTQRQWELIQGGRPSYFKNETYYASRCVEKVSYNDIRGATNGTPVINWPATRTAVAPDSFLGLLRTRTGIADFDLPTEAQSEYICHAGTTTLYNDGNADANISGINATSNSWVNVLARYRCNGGYINSNVSMDPDQYCVPTNGTATVGSYLPNAWGLYDTIGNVVEWCLDWYSSAYGGTDPVGPMSGSTRTIRGGSRWDPASGCVASGSRYYFQPTFIDSNVGFRLVRVLP